MQRTMDSFMQGCRPRLKREGRISSVSYVGKKRHLHRRNGRQHGCPRAMEVNNFRSTLNTEHNFQKWNGVLETLLKSMRHIHKLQMEDIFRIDQGAIESNLSDFDDNFYDLESYGDTGVDVTTDARVLFDAVRHGKNHLVRFILEASSVDIVNSRDLHGKTPLMACCYTKEEGARDNTVRLLLRHGADVNLTDDCGRTALSYVCERRCNDILRILIKEHNIDPDITDTNGNTPLIYSAMVGNDIACDILIRHFRRLGLNVDALNDEGFSALLMAAKHGNITCAQILMGQGKASIKHRDTKYSLSVEEWLAKKGFSLQDIAPIRNDGKGRSRFVKLANIAAICSGPKKSLPQNAQFEDIDYHLNNFTLSKYDDNEDDYVSDTTTDTNVSIPRYISRFNDIDLDFAAKHYRIYPIQRPKMKSIATQTGEFNDDDNANIIIPSPKRKENFLYDQMTEISNISYERDEQQKRKAPAVRPFEKLPETKGKIGDRQGSPDKRLSLPDIDHQKPIVSRNDGFSGKKQERKKSLDILPEKIIASIDIGDGRRHSIQLHPDGSKNKVYWSPAIPDDEERTSCGRGAGMIPRQFEGNPISVSDSDVSTNEDGPIF